MHEENKDLPSLALAAFVFVTIVFVVILRFGIH